MRTLVRPVVLWHSLDASLLDVELPREALDFGIGRIAIREALARHGASLVDVGRVLLRASVKTGWGAIFDVVLGFALKGHCRVSQEEDPMLMGSR